MLAGAHKKFYRIQHPEIYLLDLKVQYKHKMKLPLDMVSKHVLLYLFLPDYCSYYVFQYLHSMANKIGLSDHMSSVSFFHFRRTTIHQIIFVKVPRRIVMGKYSKVEGKLIAEIERFLYYGGQ